MDQVKLGSFLLLLALLCIAQNGRFVASNPVSTPSEEGNQLNKLIPSEENNKLTDRIVSYVCTVTNLFLEKVVQRNRLTKMESVVDMSNVFALRDSLKTSWKEWTTYLIGFVILFALFLVLGIVTLLFDIIYLYCCFRGNCGAVNSTKSEERESSSKACTIVCSVALTLVAAGLIVGGIAMFTTNETIRAELSVNLFDKLIKGVDHITEYLDLTVRDVNDTLFGGFLRLEDAVFGVLQDAPMKATETIANSTRGVLSTLNQLRNFTRQLDTLQRSFLDSQNVTLGFSRITGKLTDALNNTIVRTFLDVCGAVCNPIKRFLQESSSGGGFSLGALNIGSALQATSDSKGLDLLVNNSLKQLTVIEFLMNSTVSLAVKGLKITAKGVELGLSSMVSNLNKTLRGAVDVALVKDLLLIYKKLKLYRLVTEITYWFLFALASIVGIIVLLDLFGLMMGWCLPSNPTSGPSCTCSKSIGSHLLKAGISLTFIFYWIFALLVASLFISGGPIHTEVCRNIVHKDHTDSSSVLSIFDGWAVGFQKLLPLRIKPFKVYSVCQNDRPIYEAIELTQIVNFSQVTDSSMFMVKNMSSSFGDVTGKLPGVNLAGPNLTAVLGTLTSGLGESSFNFTKIYAMIEGNSMLNDLASSLQNSSNDALKRIYERNVKPLLDGRDRFLTLMRSAEAILSQISFSNVTRTLAKADAIMKSAIPTFLDSTTSSISVEIEKYVTSVVTNLPLELGRCRPVHIALKTVVDALCVDLLYPVNGYWFGLGWCTLFLIPNVFLSLYLASAFN